MEQTYDIHDSYAANYARGPTFTSAPPQVEDNGERSLFLGQRVRSRVGIAAGLLLNSKWIAAYAGRGFDILTYKTVRSSYRPCYPLPNWVFVEEREDGSYTAIDDSNLPADPTGISSSVCFGMPSMCPEIWREDVAIAKNTLGDGQMLIVSVVATPQEGWGEDELAADFVACAKWAADAGADAVEANFSCPNVCSAEGSVYLDPELSRRVASAISKNIAPVPLLIKTGYFDDNRKLQEYLSALNGAAAGITMVNCLTRPVVDHNGSPVFGNEFAQAGILGRAIHQPCVESVRQAASIVRKKSLSLEIAAVGGVSCRQDMSSFVEAGADVVLLGSSPMYLPNIAADLY